MVRALSVLLLSALCQMTFAQEGFDKYTNYYSVEGNISASFAGLGLVPTFGVYRNGSKVDVGLSIKMYDIWEDGPGILGTYMSYKYFPNQRKNDFSLYFGYHNLFTSHDKGKRFPVFYNESTDEDFYPDKVLLLENMIGIGFEYQMGNRFYMLTDFSVGVALDWETFKDSQTQLEIRSTGQIRLGLGYNVAWRQAK